jgi:hypothetical protein
MAQLESGKTYIIENIGIKNYITLKGNNHTAAEYFTWLSEKIATGLGIEMQPVINGNNCYLPLPYINDPTENRLCLYIKGDSLSNLVPKIGFFNSENFYIELGDELPHIMYGNQTSFMIIDDYYRRAVMPSSSLESDASASLVIDTEFLDSHGFYNISFLANAYCDSDEHITDLYASPRVFICDMIDVLTEEHYDGVFTLSNPNSIYDYYGGYILDNNSNSSLLIDFKAIVIPPKLV